MHNWKMKFFNLGHRQPADSYKKRKVPLHHGGFSWDDKTVAIVGIAATLFGSLIGASISANAAMGSVEAQIAATAAKEHREKVGQIYSDYLKSVDAYVSASNFLKNAGVVTTVPVPSADGGMGVSISQDDYEAYESARSIMQGRSNDLNAFGSDQAWEAGVALTATLPWLFAPDKAPAEGLEYDVKEYETAYLNFARIYCREVAVDPGKKCTA